MLFNSYTFLFVFLPTVLAGFFLLATRSHVAAAAWLMLASLVFYGWWNPAYVPLLLASIAWNYGMGARIVELRTRHRDRAARWALGIAIGVDLAALGYFKYVNFFLDTVHAIAGIDEPLLKTVLPLGISFYTFTQIAFLVDVSRGQAREYNVVHYALFVTYFPHLIAGPILHHAEMMPQFAKRSIYRPNATNLAVGATIFAIGLFKKTVLADRIAPFVGPIFDGAVQDPPTLLIAWGGALAYTMQLYFDFSGYSDMAIGLSRLFGVQLPLNFASPYKARSITEFWRRWHMTLSRFLRDYVYVPLGGNRKGAARRYVNLFVTMLLGGLWHGAGWTFVAWGALHGLYLVVNHGWTALRTRLGLQRRAGPWTFLAWLVTFVAVVVGWVLFRAPTFASAVQILRGMVGANGTSLPAAVGTRFPDVAAFLSPYGIEFTLAGGGQFLQMASWIVVLTTIALACPNTQQLMASYRPALDARAAPPPRFRWRMTIGAAIAGGAIAAAGVLSLNRVSEFLYYQF